MTTIDTRMSVEFSCAGTKLAAWHYPGSNGACVVMTGGLGVTKEPATDRFGQAFHAAGFSVLAFDHRGIGASDGMPRQVQTMRGQAADWEAAIGFAADLPEVDPARIAAWGFSTSAGHVVRLAGRRRGLAAVIAQSPNVDGPTATRNAARYQRPVAMLRMTGRGLVDVIAGLVGRPARLIPLGGAPGEVAVLTTPDGVLADTALNPGGSHPDWLQAVAARSTFGVMAFRPGREAARITCPALFVVCDDDRSVLPGPGLRAAADAPSGELVRLRGGHYAPFLDEHDVAVRTEVEFLQRHLCTE
ncbi:alpha/beta hydrolase [Flexivirga endophytica]|uniref:Alpha/beta hydrolase n=1 Tax=Flexivirga endophytica TaxID=1849103 RepID=A0A916TFP8_9MICO|nr:alpha/beta hydrolase [Flexivirga endophytica]GGB41892.1 alpha/beta hydrolase [Flexivirga endophytica]GHB69406.1 alpha/beta hydrolase [Flexivirga endophytica]